MKLASKFRQHYGILLIITAGIFLRFYHLGFQSAWLDEVLVLKESDSNSTFTEVYSAVLLRDSTSFLHIFSIHYLGKIWEHNILLARLISAVAGVLAIYYIYRLGTLMINKRVGYFAAALLTINLFHIEYSQEARSYALLTLFVTLAFYRLYHYMNKPVVPNAVYLGIFAGLTTIAHPIGILNAASLFIVLFLIFISKKDRESKKNILKGGTVTAILTLVIFIGIYPIVRAASKITSFWIPDASFEMVKQAFTELAGRSSLLLWFCIAAFLYFTINVLIEIRKNKGAFLENKVILSYVVLLSWIGLEAGVIIIKSFVGISILLSRYMIAILPGMVLVSAIGVELIKNKILKIGLIILLVAYSLNAIHTSEYYYKISKAQFKETADFVTSKNPNNDKVISRYGYVVSYYINKGNPKTEVIEKQLDDYITAMKNKSIPEDSFWYHDGNSAPYVVSAENQLYLDQKFILQDEIAMFDCWAKHYVSKTQAEKDQTAKQQTEDKLVFKNGKMKLPFKKFRRSNLDDMGNVLMFENSTIKSNPFLLPPGSYTLRLNGNSYPEIPINGENAHLKIMINDKVIGSVYLSEKKDQTQHEFKFISRPRKPTVVSIRFDNDIAIEALDRNVILYDISVEK